MHVHSLGDNRSLQHWDRHVSKIVSIAQFLPRSPISNHLLFVPQGFHNCHFHSTYHFIFPLVLQQFTPMEEKSQIFLTHCIIYFLLIKRTKVMLSWFWSINDSSASISHEYWVSWWKFGKIKRNSKSLTHTKCFSFCSPLFIPQISLRVLFTDMFYPSSEEIRWVWSISLPLINAVSSSFKFSSEQHFLIIHL